MRMSIPLAAAIGAVVVLASASPSAEAQSGSMSGPMMGPMMYSAPPKGAKAPPPRAAAKGYLPRTAGRKGPGGCGTYLYWKGGKCHDARSPSK